jgi:sarcosine oxidase
LTSVRTEFAVVGGGLTGLATARALHRHGRGVVVLEQATVGHPGGGSHGACRIFRLGYDDPAYVAFAAAARELWSVLEQETGTTLLHPTPQLTFGPQMPAVHQAMRAAGAPCELLMEQETAERFPEVAAPGPVLLEPESAVIAADRTLAALAGPADRASQTWCGARVTALADDGRQVRLSTTAGDVEAGCVVVCAGPWTSVLLATAGIAVPGLATLEQVAYLEPAVPGPARDADRGGACMPIFVHYGGEFPYGLPVPGSRRYKVGLHHAGPAIDPDHQHQAADAGISARTALAVSTILPGFDPRPVAVDRCVYDTSPDTDFIVDRIGNVVIGSGTSGHGFKFGPLIGEWLANLAMTGRPAEAAPTAFVPEVPVPPARFALSRFR